MLYFCFTDALLTYRWTFLRVPTPACLLRSVFPAQDEEEGGEKQGLRDKEEVERAGGSRPGVSRKGLYLTL